MRGCGYDEGLDVASIRRRFPALERQVGGAPAVYLDGPGGSQTPDSVAEAVADYLLDANANVGGPFVTSIDTEQLLHDAHAAAADFLGCTEEEIVFGANTTTINFLLAHAVARTLEPGDEIIVTELDHDANVSPWLLVAADRGLVVRTAPLHPSDGTLDPEAVEKLICRERASLRSRWHPTRSDRFLTPSAWGGRARSRRAGLGRRRPPRSAPARRPRRP